MSAIAQRSAALTTSPLGCAFLLYIETLRLSVETAASPLTSLVLLHMAASRVTFWQSDRQAVVDDLLAEGPRLCRLARDLLSLPETA